MTPKLWYRAVPSKLWSVDQASLLTWAVQQLRGAFCTVWWLSGWNPNVRVHSQGYSALTAACAAVTVALGAERWVSPGSEQPSVATQC